MRCGVPILLGVLCSGKRARVALAPSSSPSPDQVTFAMIAAHPTVAAVHTQITELQHFLCFLPLLLTHTHADIHTNTRTPSRTNTHTPLPLLPPDHLLTAMHRRTPSCCCCCCCNLAQKKIKKISLYLTKSFGAILMTYFKFAISSCVKKTFLAMNR